MTKYYVDNGEYAYVGTVNYLQLSNSFYIVSMFESKMVLLCVTYYTVSHVTLTLVMCDVGVKFWTWCRVLPHVVCEVTTFFRMGVNVMT